MKSCRFPTGLIAELPALKEKEITAVLRAEMDALPIREQTGLPYASVNKGCMHACGHDAILAVALVLARVIANAGASFPVRVRFYLSRRKKLGKVLSVCWMQALWQIRFRMPF